MSASTVIEELAHLDEQAARRTARQIDLFTRNHFSTVSIETTAYRMIVVRRPDFLTIVVTHDFGDAGLRPGSTFTFHHPYVEERAWGMEISGTGERNWFIPFSDIHSMFVMEN